MPDCSPASRCEPHRRYRLSDRAKFDLLAGAKAGNDTGARHQRLVTVQEGWPTNSAVSRR